METQSQVGGVQLHRAQYLRNYRAIGVLWGIFTVLLAILLIVAFIQPQWLGDTDDSPGVGYFGVYHYCMQTSNTDPLACTGSFTDFSSILSTNLKATTFFVGFTALLYLLCVLCLLCFLFMNTAIVFMICAWIQLVATVCILLGCILFPAGWDAPQIKAVCGGDTFDKGKCEIRWGYILAILAIFDSLVLCILAFVLATKQAALLPGTGGKAAEVADDRRSYIQPIVSTSENMSVYSYKSGRSGRSKRSGYKGDFQL